ncbi:MAG: hypothetical protein ACE5IZ_08295 [Dehalococcoidia bacterium]
MKGKRDVARSNWGKGRNDWMQTLDTAKNVRYFKEDRNFKIPRLFRKRCLYTMIVEPAVKGKLGTDVLERKRSAFRRLAEKRTNAILERIRILGNLANRSAYEYSAEDVEAMFAAIKRELGVTKAKFADRRERFKL